MAASASELTQRIESYYAAIDRFNTAEILQHFLPDARMTIATGDVRHEGHAAIARTYDRRANEVTRSFHGNFTHVVDEASCRAVTRLDVRRTNPDGTTLNMDCIALFVFEGDLIADLTIWMSGENSLK